MNAKREARVRSMRSERCLRSLTGLEESGPLRVDRRSKWGNPFAIGRDGDRAQVIEKYRQDLWKKINEGRIDIEQLAKMTGRDLVCWCHPPHACHAEVLLGAIQWAVQEREKRM